MTDAAMPASTETSRPKVPRDAVAQGGLAVVVIAYLVIALVLPLGFVFAKALQTYSFRLDLIEIEFDRGDGFDERATLAEWAERSGFVVNDGIRASERSREQVVKIIPKPQRSDVQAFRVRDLSETGGLLLIDGQLNDGDEWIELERRRLGKVQIRPVRAFSFSNFSYYFSTPSLRNSIWNSIWVSLTVVLIVVPLAFTFAYALTRSNIRFKSSFRLIATIPVLAPSLLPAIGLVYLLGRQGVIKEVLFGAEVYGPIGIIISSAFFTFPHAMIIMLIALSAADQRLYEAAEVLGASKIRTFLTVTIPGARYGLISAGFVVFTLVITDFGVPKVIGGGFNMLALDIYKQVVGQQNFQIGAVVSIVLLIPAVLAFAVDRFVSRRQTAQLTSRAAPYVIKPDVLRDRSLFAVCGAVSVVIVGIIGMCQFAALAKFWPYNLELGLQHYDFNRMDGGGWASYWNSLKMASLAACIGAVVIFLGAYVVEKARGFLSIRSGMQFLAMMPMAVPGMVLGLAYIFFFNEPANPLNFLYGTLAILVISTITHFYTVAHITSATALKQMDPEFESVSMSLKQPFWRTLSRVTVPVCLPAILEVWLYIFVNAMTTVSAVVFLYSPTTTLASIAVLNMDDAGDIAPAAAMGLMIFYTNAGVRIVHSLIVNRVIKSQRWRRR